MLFSEQKIDYPEVMITIKANAPLGKMYFVMNTLSAIMASYGSMTNSAAVVIEAMLVAMMLVPITGEAVATALVPSLAASGILFANGEMQLGLGAALSAVINIIAIQFTNVMVLGLSALSR